MNNIVYHGNCPLSETSKCFVGKSLTRFSAVQALYNVYSNCENLIDNGQFALKTNFLFGNKERKLRKEMIKIRKNC